MFRDLDFPAAMAAGKAESKLILLDAMTSWCGPCKVMDATTWVDADVTKWVAANAVAVQLDMDVHESVKTQIGVKAFPTMVLLRPDGSEFDRVVGLRTPEEMMVWLRGAESGTREIDRVRAQMAKVASDPKSQPMARARLASAALSLGALEEAEQFALWLWAHNPEDEGDSLFLSRWRQGQGRNLTGELLSGGSQDFAAAIARQIGQREAQLDQAEDARLRAEWISLLRASGRAGDVARWASILAVEPSGQDILKGHGDTIFDLLVDEGQWAAAGHSLKRPLDRVRFLGDNLGAYDLKPEDDGATDGKSVPMVPMGAMKPATGTKPAAAPKEQDRRKSIPAIPLGGMRPATKKAQAKETSAGQEGAPKSIPAIPLGGMKPATKGKAMPAIPMGGGAPKSVEARPAPKTDQEVAIEVRARLTHQLRRTAARRYAALHAAARTAEADAVAALLMKYADDNPSRAALVGCAMRAGQLGARSDVHLDWLDDIARGAAR